MNDAQGHLLILSGPSGTGKTSLSRRLAEDLPDMRISVSYTTRPRRLGERDGEDYRFVDRETFERMIRTGGLLEYAEVHGSYYGTSMDWLQQQLAHGCDVLLEIDWQGAQQVREHYPESIGVFLLPPDFSALIQRLMTRGQDRERLIYRRTRNASLELVHYREYQYQLVNDDFEHTLSELKAIVAAVRSGTGYTPNIDAGAHVAALLRQAEHQRPLPRSGAAPCTSAASGVDFEVE